MHVNKAGHAPSVDTGRQRRKYQSPSLSVFGKVAALTQSASGCAKFDNGLCFLTPGNMGRRVIMLSDRSLKENIVRIGDHPELGIGLYLFDYKSEFRDQWGHGRQFGVMADEVEAVMPQAVCVHPDGYKMVDYGMLGISRSVH